MCGIIANFYHKPIDGKDNKSIIAIQYYKQQHRGTQGAGYIVIDNDNKIHVHRDSNNTNALIQLAKYEYVKCCVFHHRYPTSTDNIAQCSHPIHVSIKGLKYDYYIVHNGVINNDDELKLVHNKEGIVYNTEHVQVEGTTYTFNNGDTYESNSDSIRYNDSEGVSIEMARLIENKVTTLEHVTGSYALIAVQVDRKTKRAVAVYSYRNNSNPLKLSGDYVFSLASENTGDDIVAGRLYSCDMQGVITDRLVLEYAPVTTQAGFYTGTNSKTYQGTTTWNAYDDDDDAPCSEMAEYDKLDSLYYEYERAKTKTETKRIKREIDKIESTIYR